MAKWTPLPTGPILLPMAKGRKNKGMERSRTSALPDRNSQDRRVYPPIPLKAWFKHVGVKAREVAEAIGVDESTLSLIASGRRDYMRHHLEDIAEFLSKRARREITPDMLLRPPGARPSLDAIISQIEDADVPRVTSVLEAFITKR